MLDIAKMGDIVEIIAKLNSEDVQAERPEGYAHSSLTATVHSVMTQRRFENRVGVSTRVREVRLVRHWLESAKNVSGRTRP